jgi:hypothetical protein
MMFRDGQRVAYVGFGNDWVLPGNEGLVLTANATYADVKWQRGHITSTPIEDLAPVGVGMSVEATLDDSLDYGLEVLAVSETMDQEGAEGLLNRMASTGHLQRFREIAEEALDLVASRVRRDPSFQAVLASLPEEEGESLVRLASTALIRDAFLSDEDD